MAQKKGRRALFTAIAILVVLLAVIGTIAVIKAVAGSKDDPYKQTTTQQPADTSSKSDTSNTTTDTSNSSTNTNQSSSTQTPDPSTVATIDIPPMNITVSYVKGIGGFEYEVLRSSGGTRYVEFRSPDLIGTKCTNDQGTFASIIENPTSDESTIISQKTTVDGVVYGLSLPDASCTTNPDLLAKYQKSFSDAFPLLKKMS